MHEYFINATVVTRYGSQRSYRVDGIDFKSSPAKHTFVSTHKTDGTAQKITMIDYFKDAYNVRLREKDQPLLILNRRKGKVFLPPEMCLRVGLDHEIFSNAKTMKTVRDCISRTPLMRLTEAQDLNKSLANSQAFEEFGLKLSKEPQELNSRRLLNPVIYRQKGKGAEPQQLNQLSYEEPVEFSNWLLVYGERDYDTANTFFSNLVKAKDRYGFDVMEPSYCEIAGKASGRSFAKTIDSYLTDCEADNVKFQFIVVISPFESMYKEIKLCLNRWSIPSQVVREHMARGH